MVSVVILLVLFQIESTRKSNSWFSPSRVFRDPELLFFLPEACLAIW